MRTAGDREGGECVSYHAAIDIPFYETLTKLPIYFVRWALPFHGTYTMRHTAKYVSNIHMVINAIKYASIEKRN